MNTETNSYSNLPIHEVREAKKASKNDLCLDRAVLRQRCGVRVKSALMAGKDGSFTGTGNT